MNLVAKKLYITNPIECDMEKNRTRREIINSLNVLETHYRFVLKEGGSLTRKELSLKVYGRGWGIEFKGVGK